MISLVNKGLFSGNAVKRCLNQLKTVYEHMDRAYEMVARHYGFHCDGCEENCCRTRFHHHTLVEYLYLMEGVRQLNQGQQARAIQRAKQVVEETRSAQEAGQPVRLMCPLNEKALCLVYPWRPMICRLHGLPHELWGPGGVTRGEGCRQFDTQAQGKPYHRFDRTPLYKDMALLERDLRQAVGFSPKIKMTVAEMLTAENMA